MGESYPCVERYGHLERYLPRYTTPARYLDPYSRRDIYLPPPRYLRPLHRYTPRPTRVEYRAHVEYLGSSGGRFVRTPPLGRSEEVSRRVEPPPLALCCNQQPQSTPSRPLTQRHLHTSPTPPPSAPTQPLTPTPTPPPPTPTIWRNVGQSPTSSSPSPPSQTTSTTPPSMMDSGVYSRSGVSSSETPSSCSSVQPPSGGGGGPVRTQSEPAPAPQPHRAPPPPLVTQQSVPVTKLDWQHAHSRTEILKQKLKKNTAIFFGVDEATQEKERTIWLGRRKRLASRRCGQLKEDPTTPSLKVGTPEVGQLSKDETDSRLTHKPSVAKMTFNGLALLVAALNKQQQRSTTVVDGGPLRRPSSNSYSMRMFGHETTPHSPTDDEVFFDCSVVNLDSRHPAPPPPQAFGDDSNSELLVAPGERPRERHNSWKREGRREESPKVGLNRISGKMLDRAHDNSDRKQFGQGIIPRLFGRSLKRSVMSRGPIKEQLEDLEDHRPFFTYWLSTVQILILFISLISYGFGPFGMDLTHQSGLVLVTSLSLQQVEYTEPANFWLGPRAADLIHLGAKFAPCMRRDAKIMKEIEKGRERERETACCIRNDDSGCVQLSQVECSSTISTWKKWGPGDAGPGGRISGSVCGLDPKYCEAPASVAPYEWPDDITKWPICRKTSSPVQRLRPKDKLAAEHMVCEVIGHPCCIGIHATCKITTKEYCDFVHGTFHDEASLCSQVSCLTDVCGMLPFINSEVPDQFYRLVTSIFLHAGLIQLGISLWIQWFLMRDLEKLTGTARLIIIYIGSGVAGNLASAIFIPYRADVGPAGSQSGLLACLIVEIFNVWPMLRHPYRALLKHLAIAAALFLIGLLPWFDNFSSFFGFLFGFLLSYALLPFASLGEYDRQKKIFIIWVCLLTAVFLFLLLVLFFYVIPVYDCELCGYFNCLPLTRDFCSAQNINFKRADSPV